MSERLTDEEYRAWIDAGSPNELEGWAIILALRAENERLREALEWYAAESDEKFQIVDSKGEAIANFQSFTSRARAALKDTPQ